MGVVVVDTATCDAPAAVDTTGTVVTCDTTAVVDGTCKTGMVVVDSIREPAVTAGGGNWGALMLVVTADGNSGLKLLASRLARNRSSLALSSLNSLSRKSL